MILLGTIAAVYAELPAPSYRVHLEQGAAQAVAQLARDQGLDAARRFAEEWQKELGTSAALAYELGLACRLAGQDAEARQHLDRALKLDPEHLAARYDRGELRLLEGDLDGAAEDFALVVRLAPGRWAGHFRLADLAARKRDIPGLSAHLDDALRSGFDLRTLIGDPRWREWLTDPELGPPLRTLILEYGGDDVLSAIERGAAFP